MVILELGLLHSLSLNIEGSSTKGISQGVLIRRRILLVLVARGVAQMSHGLGILAKAVLIALIGFLVQGSPDRGC
jgi:hypothetical protein